MSGSDAIVGLVVSVLVTGYLIFALLLPEKL
jgi:K+-transporting ATPase KdpF subunit